MRISRAWKRQIMLHKLADDRTPEQRRRAIIVYDVAFALFQEWHVEAVRRNNIRKLRGVFREKEAA